MPQVREQVEKLENAVISQSIGHSVMWHGVTVTWRSQGLPPKAAGLATDRWLVKVPWPHVTEQVVFIAGRATMGESMQSTGQACSLQASLMRVQSHAAPPYRAAMTTLRVLKRVPLPHERVQTDHPVSEPTVQSIGQWWVLQEVFLFEGRALGAAVRSGGNNRASAGHGAGAA